VATTDMSRKEGGAVPLSQGGSGSPSHCGLAEVYFCTKWHLHPSSRLATIDMGRKLGLRPLLGRGAGFPSNTMLSGLRPTSLPSGILIHPVIWPQQIWAENWGLRPLLGRELASQVAQCGLGRGLPSDQVAS